jgi:hypothetical protein
MGDCTSQKLGGTLGKGSPGAWSLRVLTSLHPAELGAPLSFLQCGKVYAACQGPCLRAQGKLFFCLGLALPQCTSLRGHSFSWPLRCICPDGSVVRR